MRLGERLRGLTVSALMGVGSALVRLGAKLDGLNPAEPEAPPPPQNPLTPESFELLEQRRPRAPTLRVNHRPLQGSVRERYARARARRGF